MPSAALNILVIALPLIAAYAAGFMTRAYISRRRRQRARSYVSQRATRSSASSAHDETAAVRFAHRH